MTEKETLEKYTSAYLNALVKNKQTIIDSYVECYGEEYRNTITNRYNQIVFLWHVNYHIEDMVKNHILTSLIYRYIDASCEILEILGIKLEIAEVVPTEYPRILDENGNISFTGAKYKSIVGENSEELIPYLKLIFGDDIFYSFDNENTPLYNFEKMDHNSQIEFFKNVLKKDEITEIDFQNIRKAIEFINGLSRKKEEITKFCKNYIDMYKAYTYLVFVNENNDGLPSKDNIIGSTYSNIFEDEKVSELALKCLNEEVLAGATNLVDLSGTLVMFPVMMVTDLNIIHEIGHSLVLMPLIGEEDEYISISGTAVVPCSNGTIQNKFGVKRQTDIEELFNEMISVETTDIFHKKGGVINPFDEALLPTQNNYIMYFPLIRSFYEKYKDVIKEARITGNKNLLLNTIGKDKYEEFTILLLRIKKVTEMTIAMLKNAGTSIGMEDYHNTYKKEDIEALDRLVESMPNPPSKEDRKRKEQEELNEMIKRLTIEDKKVTILPYDDGNRAK